jgi:hypothetical protein
MEKNRRRILRWRDLRFHTGFSEWLSHVYYGEDLTALLALFDIAKDGEIHRKAEMVIDLILLDMALNTFKGVFGSTHGRAYENTKKWASNEGTTDTSKLLFGMGVFSGGDTSQPHGSRRYGSLTKPEFLSYGALSSNAIISWMMRSRFCLRLGTSSERLSSSISNRHAVAYSCRKIRLAPCTAEWMAANCCRISRQSRSSPNMP